MGEQGIYQRASDFLVSIDSAYGIHVCGVAFYVKCNTSSFQGLREERNVGGKVYILEGQEREMQRSPSDAAGVQSSSKCQGSSRQGSRQLQSTIGFCAA